MKIKATSKTIGYNLEKLNRDFIPKKTTVQHLKSFWDEMLGLKNFWANKCQKYSTKINDWLGGDNSELSNRNLHKQSFEVSKQALINHFPQTWFKIDENYYMQHIQKCNAKKLFKINQFKNGLL